MRLQLHETIHYKGAISLFIDEISKRNKACDIPSFVASIGVAIRKYIWSGIYLTLLACAKATSAMSVYVPFETPK